MHRSLMSCRLAILLLTAAAGSGCLGCGGIVQPIGRLTTAPVDLVLDHPQHRELPMRFQPTARPLAGGCPTVFVHLTDAEGRVVRTFDHRPPAWTPGEELEYRLTLHQSALAEPLPGGRYRLLAGLYSPDVGMRHRLETTGWGGGGRYEIGSVTVAGAAPTWELDFAGGWQEPEAGSDSQVLTRRWFRRQARLTLRDEAARQPVELRLLLRVPEAGAGESQHLADGAAAPRLTVAASCIADRAELAPGRRELRFAVPAAGLRQGCAFELAANFELRSPALATPRSASLETISWRPADG